MQGDKRLERGPMFTLLEVRAVCVHYLDDGTIAAEGQVDKQPFAKAGRSGL
jgi:hypothetical protein